ncbi:hypothetical protein [Rhodanobacter thiooxydans]|uniref:hypothetical protein n=1 Tax=Rhodanobacter thiooxydans TaxID=416169 RepID=UPI000AE4FA7B|nr:hypothetical protein [Rhodanobacter thiooxydans]MCW0202974.1 hypothetical protein [Rhodanobacter thiooxydans]
MKQSRKRLFHVSESGRVPDSRSKKTTGCGFLHKLCRVGGGADRRHALVWLAWLEVTMSMR